MVFLFFYKLLVISASDSMSDSTSDLVSDSDLLSDSASMSDSASTSVSTSDSLKGITGMSTVHIFLELGSESTNTFGSEISSSDLQPITSNYNGEILYSQNAGDYLRDNSSGYLPKAGEEDGNSIAIGETLLGGGMLATIANSK